MKKRIPLFILFSLFSLFSILCGCQQRTSTDSAQKFSTTIFAMNTVMDITVYGGSQEILTTASNDINALEAKLSTTKPESEVSRLNEAGSMVLSDEVAALLERGLSLCEETDGALDLSIYPIVKAWGFTTGEYQVPSDDTLKALLAYVDYQKIKLSGNTATLQDNMAIDFGSISKGYTADYIIEYFKQQGITSALLNLGGNVQTLGTKPNGNPWVVGIQDPNSNGSIGEVTVADQAVVTAGGYERFFKGDDGQVYWHIMDPATGKPSRSGLLSVTIVGSEGIRCDALSTALFVKGEAGAIEFWRSHQDFEMLLITDDGRIIITPSLNERFTPAKALSYAIEVIPC